MQISEIRQKYPQYSDMSDQEFADKFHAKYYSDIPKEQFYEKVGLGSNNLGQPNNDHSDLLSNFANNTVSGARDLTEGALTGMLKGGQFLGQQLRNVIPGSDKLAHALQSGTGISLNPQYESKAFKFVGDPNKGLGGKVLEGLGEYLPYAFIGGPSLAGQIGAGGLFGASTAEEGNRGYGAAEGALINALAHGAAKGLDKLKIGNLFRGTHSIEDIQKNAQIAGNTHTGIGNTIGSPMWKRLLENILTKIPNSGANDALAASGREVREKGQALVQSLLGKHSPDTVIDEIYNSLADQSKKETIQKNRLYKESNDLADKVGFKVKVPNFSEKLDYYKDAIENTKLLKADPEVNNMLNKIKNFSITKPKKQEITLKEANLLKGRLRSYADQVKSSPNLSERNYYSFFNTLSNSLKDDIHSGLREFGHEGLHSSYKAAEKNYAENFSPHLDKEIYKYTHGNKDSDTITQSFIKTSKRADRVNQVSKLIDKLPEDKKPLVAYDYLSKAFDKDGRIRPGYLTTLIHSLGPKQLKKMIPNELIRNELKNYTTLYKHNEKGVHLMENPETGQKNSDVIMHLLGALGTGTGFALGHDSLSTALGTLAGYTLPGLAAQPLVKLLTNPSVRNRIVQSIVKNQNKPKKSSIKGQVALQALANQNTE